MSFLMEATQRKTIPSIVMKFYSDPSKKKESMVSSKIDKISSFEFTTNKPICSNDIH